MHRSAFSPTVVAAFASLLLPVVCAAGDLDFAPDGAWSIFPPSLRAEHAAIFDPVRKRTLIFGGHVGARQNDVWSFVPDAAQRWTLLEVGGTPPSPRDAAIGLYDPVRDRMLIVGGGPTSEVEVWALELSGVARWEQIRPPGPVPAERVQASVVYDSIRDRVLVFGGRGRDGHLDDVWALELSVEPRWSRLDPAGEDISERARSCAVFDPSGNRMIVFGGQAKLASGSLTEVNELWSLELSEEPTWRQLRVDGTQPNAPLAARAVYVPADNRMLFLLHTFPGAATPTEWERDLWSLSLDPAPRWEALEMSDPPTISAAGTLVQDEGGLLWVHQSGTTWSASPVRFAPWHKIDPVAEPRSRVGAAGMLDGASQRLLIFGGQHAHVGMENDLWAFALGDAPAWSPVIPVGSATPVARMGAIAVEDTRRHRLLLYGGSTLSPDGFLLVRQNDVWELTLGSQPEWTPLLPDGEAPTEYARAAFYDPGGDRLIVIGTRREPGLLQGETEPTSWVLWELSLAGHPKWSRLEPDGPAPPARYGAASLYDPPRRRLLLFGGVTYQATVVEPRPTYWNDVWALRLDGASPRWEPVLPRGEEPSAREGSRAAYDPVGDRMIVFAGGGFEVPAVETWELALRDEPEWRQLSPSGARMGGNYPLATWDPKGDRMLAFGTRDVAALTFARPIRDVRARLLPGTGIAHGEHGGTIRVALISSASIDASRCEPTSLSWNGIAVARDSRGDPDVALKDVDHDGATDMIARFPRIALSSGRLADEHEIWAATGQGERVRAVAARHRAEPDFAEGEIDEERDASVDVATPLRCQVLRSTAREIVLKLSPPVGADPFVVELWSVAGRRVATGTPRVEGAIAGVIRLPLDQRLPAGLYFLRVRRGDETVSNKVLVLP